MTSVIYRALHHSIERNKEPTANITNLNVTALHLVGNLLLRVALHLVHARASLFSIYLEQRSTSHSMSLRTCVDFCYRTTVCIHMYDEWKRSNEMIVCHKLCSILWSIVQIFSLTIEYQVFQYVPSICISEQFENILLTFLPRISILLLLWNDGHQCMELIFCRVVGSSCLPTHNIVPHISWHVFPYRRTTKKYSYFPSMVVFQLLLLKFWM